MKALSFVFLIWLVYQPIFADTPADDSKTQDTLKGNVVDFRDWLIKELSQFPKTPNKNMAVLSRMYASIPRKGRVISSNQYNQAAKSDWVKGQVLQGLSTLSQQLANTAGTAFAPQGAGQLQQYSTQLQQSNDPQFQQVGALYSQEAQALQTGNTQAANQAASQVAVVPQPYVPPGYQPSQNETSLAATLNQITGQLINAVLGVVITLYGGPAATALYSQTLGPVFTSGQNPGTSIANAGNSTLQTGGSSALQQLGSVNVKQLQNQGSSNAGVAPPAQ